MSPPPTVCRMLSLPSLAHASGWFTGADAQGGVSPFLLGAASPLEHAKTPWVPDCFSRFRPFLLKKHNAIACTENAFKPTQCVK